MKAVDECESERHDSAGIDTALPHDADSLHTLLDIAREVSGIARAPDLTVRGFVIQSRAVVVNSSEPPTDIDFLEQLLPGRPRHGAQEYRRLSWRR